MTESSPSQQKTPTQPPEPPKEVVVQPPVHNDVTVSAPEQDQPLDLGLPVTPEPTSEADATVLQQTTAPPEHPEVTLPHPEPVQAQQPTLIKVMVQLLGLEVIKTQESVP